MVATRTGLAVGRSCTLLGAGVRASVFKRVFIGLILSFAASCRSKMPSCSNGDFFGWFASKLCGKSLTADGADRAQRGRRHNHGSADWQSADLSRGGSDDGEHCQPGCFGFHSFSFLFFVRADWAHGFLHSYSFVYEARSSPAGRSSIDGRSVKLRALNCLQVFPICGHEFLRYHSDAVEQRRQGRGVGVGVSGRAGLTG